LDLVCKNHHSNDPSHILTVSEQVLANLLSLAGVCPFVGSLSDLIGRRYVAIIGASLICLGMIVSSTANTMNIFIGVFPRDDPFYFWNKS
jgi:MFS family permease